LKRGKESDSSKTAEGLTRHTSKDSAEELEQEDRSRSETPLRQPENLDVELGQSCRIHEI